MEASLLLNNAKRRRFVYKPETPPRWAKPGKPSGSLFGWMINAGQLEETGRNADGFRLQLPRRVDRRFDCLTALPSSSE